MEQDKEAVVRAGKIKASRQGHIATTSDLPGQGHIPPPLRPSRGRVLYPSYWEGSLSSHSRP